MPLWDLCPGPAGSGGAQHVTRRDVG